MPVGKVQPGRRAKCVLLLNPPGAVEIIDRTGAQPVVGAGRCQACSACQGRQGQRRHRALWAPLAGLLRSIPNTTRTGFCAWLIRRRRGSARGSQPEGLVEFASVWMPSACLVQLQGLRASATGIWGVVASAASSTAPFPVLSRKPVCFSKLRYRGRVV